MIERLISWSVRFPARVIAAVIFVCAVSGYAVYTMPLDAMPDFGDPQVIVEIVWEAPVERLDREAAEPVSRALISVPGVRRVRTTSEMGYAFVYAILADGADVAVVRREITARIALLGNDLPPDAAVRIGPDASSVGWIYQYALVDRSRKLDLRQLYDLQTRRIAPALSTVPGVAEIATVGGLKRQIQIHVYPSLLAQYRLPLSDVLRAVQDALADAGGRMIEVSGRDFQIRAVSPVRSLDDLEAAVVGRTRDGKPVRIRDIGFLQTVYDLRRGIADLDGRGEAVGGIVVMRQGENALKVLAELKHKLNETRSLLPDGVEWICVYDRSTLIQSALSKMGWTLLEELAAVAIVCFLFLLHMRSALVPILILPAVCLLPFLFLRITGAPIHLPILAGIALALGEIVDAVLVMVENVHRKNGEMPDSAEKRSEILSAALSQIGRPLFFSLAIILFSFLPVFLLEAQEGRLFRPLALAKTFAMVASVLLSITLGPALITLLLRGKLPAEELSPLMRGLLAIYAPTFRWALRHRGAIVILNLMLLLAIPYWLRLDRSFMPPLEEGSILYMPTTLPGLPLRDAGWILQEQDRILKNFPEVETVFGKAGRAETPTDPAPISMIETTLTLRPQSAWRKGVTLESLITEMDAAMQFPGWINSWTQPIRGRMDMLATGVRTEVGVVLYADDLGRLESAAQITEKTLAGIEGVRNAYAERPTQGYFLDVRFDREALGRTGLTEREAADLLRVSMAGANIAQLYGGAWDTGDLAESPDPVTVLFVRDFVDEVHKIEELPVVLPGGRVVPLSTLGAVRLRSAPANLRREQGRWAGYVHADVIPTKSGAVVSEARKRLSNALPAGVQSEFVGQFQYRDRAIRRMAWVMPAVLAVILFLLWKTFGSIMEAFILMLSVPAAMAGGVFSQAAAGYPTTVAVLVGYIALYAVAVQTGVVMVTYLQEALASRKEDIRRAGRPWTPADLDEAVYIGSVQRLRPKLMTVATTVLGFLPILWSEGPGAEMLRHIAVPMIGGMITSTIHVLYLTPILFYWLHRPKAANAVKSELR